jgi:chemotaxis protein histidine kinase CheA
VEDHRGSIRVEENKPFGSRFVVELPITAETVSAPAAS